VPPFLRGLGEAAFLGYRHEVAQMPEAIVFIASEQASFLTGQIVSVDGGKSAQ
jgi:NAD(P)-dependent dehydrogenase (short-subunit alcohol dehydrogenase family)